MLVIVVVFGPLLPVVTVFELTVAAPLPYTSLFRSVNTNPCPHSITLSVPGPLTNTGAPVSTTTIVCELVVRLDQMSTPDHPSPEHAVCLLLLDNSLPRILTGPPQLW